MRICYGCMNEVPDGQPCPICGGDVDTSNPENMLPCKYILAERYLIGKIIESNGEGATYIAFDRTTMRTVRVREFFPTGLCTRNEDGTVAANEDDKFVYNSCLMKFINLHKSLYALKEMPALIPIVNIFEMNGTAYSVTEDVPSVTMREFLIKNGGTLTWEQIKSLFVTAIPTLKELHSNGIIHRGLSPDTMLVGTDGKLRISGFCIPESRVADSPVTSQLFPGFAAAEQYGKLGEVSPATDVYSFAAVIYRALVGTPPLEATERLVEDRMSIPAKTAEALPQAALEMLADCLKLDPAERISDIDEIREIFLTTSSAAAERRPKRASNPQKKEPHRKKKGESKNVKYAVIAAAFTIVVLAAAAFGIRQAINRGSDTDANSSSSLPDISSSLNQSSSAPSEDVKYYSVPDFSGLTYQQIISDENNDVYKIVIGSKQYSDTVAKGEVISQSPVKETNVTKDTEVTLVISLGPDTVSVPNIIGMDKNSAIIELMKLGFSYDNIEIGERYDDTKLPGTVVSVSPSSGRVTVDKKIKVDINSYTGSDAADADGGTDLTEQ